jgi:uncharacterized protein (DUF983 family)
MYPRNPNDDADLTRCPRCGGDPIRDWMGMYKLTIKCTACNFSVWSSDGPDATEKLWTAGNRNERTQKHDA